MTAHDHAIFFRRTKSDLKKYAPKVLVTVTFHVLFFSFFTEHADILLHKAFLVGIYGQIDTSSMISESMKVLHMEATT